MYKRTKCNRKYAFEDLQKRIAEAETEAELELISDLVDELGQCDMLTSSQYRELDYALDQRLCDLVLEGKI